jgi:hypothetical protein
MFSPMNSKAAITVCIDDMQKLFIYVYKCNKLLKDGV